MADRDWLISTRRRDTPLIGQPFVSNGLDTFLLGKLSLAEGVRLIVHERERGEREGERE